MSPITGNRVVRPKRAAKRKLPTGGSPVALVYPSDHEVNYTRLFDAPRSLVYKAITDPAVIPQWWGPRWYGTTVVQHDVRQGGSWRYLQRDAEGKEIGFHGSYREVVPDKKVSRTFEYEPMPGAVMMETAELSDAGGKTRLEVSLSFFNREDRDGFVRSGAEIGINASNERLEEYLALSQPERAFTISRVFDAPRKTVFEVWSTLEHLKRWFGPKGCEVQYLKEELHPGGHVHYKIALPGFKTHYGMAYYREITPISRMVWVQWFSDAKGGVTRHFLEPRWPVNMLTIVDFSDEGGKTRVNLVWGPLGAAAKEEEVFVNAREQMVGGWGGSFEVLAEYLRTLKE